MPLSDYIVGALFFGVAAGATAATASLVVRAHLSWMEVEARSVAWALLFTGALALVHLLPLILGVLTRGTVAAGALGLLAVSARVCAGAPGPARGELAVSDSPRGGRYVRAQWALAGFALLVSVGYLVVFLRAYRSVAITDIDSTMFHLPGVASWISSGSLWHATDYVPGWGFGAYPQTGNLLQLAVLLPWHSDFLVRAVNPAYLVLGGVCVYGLAVELGAARAMALTLAGLAFTLPVAAPAGLKNGQTDMIMAASLAAGVLFLVRHERTGRRSELLLAGLGLGLAFGSKWYGPPDVVAVLVVWTVLRRAPSRDFRAPALVVAAVGVVGGFWLLRNAILYANPIFPARIALFGTTIFHGPARTGASGVTFSLLHFAGNGAAWRRDIWPQLRASFGAGGGLLLIGVLASLVAAARLRDRRLAIIACCGLAAVIVWAITPDSALNAGHGRVLVDSATRYTLPAILLGAGAVAAAAKLLGRWAIAAQILVLVLMADALSRDENFLGLTTHALALTVLVLGLALLTGWALWRVTQQRRQAPGALLLVGGCLLTVFALLGARKVQQDFSAARYRGIEPAYDFLANLRPAVHVAIAGTPGRDPVSSPIVAFGARFQNRVGYVGGRDHHLLVRYTTQMRFARALRNGDYDLLLVGVADPELGWAQASGWQPIAVDRGVVRGFALLRNPHPRPRDPSVS